MDRNVYFIMIWYLLQTFIKILHIFDQKIPRKIEISLLVLVIINHMYHYFVFKIHWVKLWLKSVNGISWVRFCWDGLISQIISERIVGICSWVRRWGHNWIDNLLGTFCRREFAFTDLNRALKLRLLSLVWVIKVAIYGVVLFFHSYIGSYNVVGEVSLIC